MFQAISDEDIEALRELLPVQAEEINSLRTVCTRLVSWVLLSRKMPRSVVFQFNLIYGGRVGACLSHLKASSLKK